MASLSDEEKRDLGSRPGPADTGDDDSAAHLTGIEKAVIRRLKEKGKAPPWAKITKQRIAVYNDIRPESEDRPEANVELPALMAYNYWLRGVQSDAMRLINHLNMSAFRKQFQAQRGAVDLATFIHIVRRIMRSRKGMERAGPLIEGLDDDEITARLMELFREIDLDGDGKIVWEEFSRFICDKAQQVGQQIGAEEREAKLFPYRSMRRQGASQHFKRKNPYEHVVAVTGRTLVAAVENESPTITFYDMRRHAAQVGCIRSRAKVLAMLNLPHPINIFVTSHADMVMRTWNLDEGPSSTRWSVKSQWPLADNQHCLCYAPSHKLLFSGGSKGEISGWSISERELKTSFSGHDDTVLDLISLTGLDVLASGSSDTSVCIWDLHVGTLRQRLLGHQKGVVSLGFCPPQRLIVSGGYDHEAFVWSPFVSTLLHKLVGHDAPITAVQSVEDRPEVITGDSNGVVKIWDLRTYRCIQSFIADEGELTCTTGTTGGGGTGSSSNNHSDGSAGTAIMSELHADGVASIAHVAISRNVSRLAVATKRLNYFEQERSASNDVTDDLPISCAIFNEVCYTIITAAGNGIKVWDAILGNIKATYPNVVKGDITALCLDDRHRKIMVGDMAGDVNVVTHHSGMWMKAFDKASDASVVSIVYSAPGKQVLVGYADYTMHLFDESLIQTCPILRSFNMDDGQPSLDGAFLTALALHPHRYAGRGPYVATGSGRAHDPLALWSFAVGNCEAMLSDGGYEEEDGQEEDTPEVVLMVEQPQPQHKRQEEGGDNDNKDEKEGPSFSVLAMTFLGDSPLLAASCSDGYVRVWAAWPIAGAVRTCILRFANKDPKDYVYDGEEDQPYPLLHPPGTGTAPVYPSIRPTVVSKASALAREGGGQVTKSKPPIPEDPRLREWRAMPRLDSPRRRLPVPVSCLVWDEATACLFTGDEGGRIRRWDLSALYGCLKEHGLLVKEREGVWKTMSIRMKASKPIKDQLHFLYSTKPSLVWSLEAHDDVITCMSLVSEPRGILSGGVDQRVRMWSMGGRPFGKLLQSVASSAKNKEWNLSSFDVSKVIRKEEEAIHMVEEMVLLERQKRKAMRLELGAQSSLFSLEASTIATQPSIVSLESQETYGSMSLDGTSSSVMTTVSVDGHHQALMYLASLDKDPIFSRKLQATPPKLHEMADQPKMLKHLQAIRMDMTLKAAAKARHQQQYAPTFHFRKKATATTPNQHHSTSSKANRQREAKAKKDRLADTQTFLSATAAAAVEPLRIPASPRRKETMERDVEDAILSLRRRLSWIDARAPPPLFPAQKVNFRDFAKDVLSPMVSGDNSILSNFSGVANQLAPLEDGQGEPIVSGKRLSISPRTP